MNITNFLISRYIGFSINSVHLWYLYAYIAFLIALPFLRAMATALDDKYYYYMVVLALVLDFVPMVELLLFDGKYELAYYFKNLWIVRDIVLYPCVGYFIHEKMDFKNKGKQIVFLWGACFFAISVACYMTHYRGQVTGVLEEADSQIYHNSFAVLSMMVVFITIKYIYEKIEIPKLINNCVISIGKSSFGIYLLHLMVKKFITQDAVIDGLISIGINRLVAALLYCLLLSFISYLITQILMKIPILKKLVIT